MSFDGVRELLYVVAPLVAIIGVIIALFQLRNQNRLRQFDTVMRLFLAFGEERFMRHYRRVTTWDYDRARRGFDLSFHVGWMV